MRIKKGDTVVVISGKNKYQLDKKGNKVRVTGTVIEVNHKDETVKVQGVNMVKKHLKPTQTNQSGSIVETEAPIHVSNVAILDPKTNEPTRVYYSVDDKGNKVRVTKKSNTVLK